MTNIVVLSEKTIDEISRQTGQSRKTLSVKLKEAKDANTLLCFTLSPASWRKV